MARPKEYLVVKQRVKFIMAGLLTSGASSFCLYIMVRGFIRHGDISGLVLAVFLTGLVIPSIGMIGYKIEWRFSANRNLEIQHSSWGIRLRTRTVGIDLPLSLHTLVIPVRGIPEYRIMIITQEGPIYAPFNQLEDAEECSRRITSFFE